MQQLVLNKLKNYNLFSDINNKLILRALLNSSDEIKIFLKSHYEESYSIQLFNHLDKQISDINLIFSEDKTIITLKGIFKLTSNYIVKINNEQANVILNPEINGILDTDFNSQNTDFGVNIKNNCAYFKLWSPPAVKIELLLFDENQTQIKLNKSILLNNKQGIWSLEISPEIINSDTFNNIYYQYKIFAYGKENIALDPYAKSMAPFDSESEDKIGKGSIINLQSKSANPINFNKTYSNYKYIANETDLIAYEINIRDFTIQPGIVNDKISGTFKGLIEKIDYLKELGITHVQFMPVNKAYTQYELDRTYTGKTAHKSNYNWGYDPMNYFTLEGRYSTNPHNPYSRIYEFKEMIQALHNAGIGVILDVVFNHTYIADTFENIAPGCYYRLNQDYTISGHTGAGPSIESRRLQVRKFIIDVLKFYVKEFHIDGFRFDLMSFTDKETMRQIRKEVGLTYNPKNPNELILQGEAWNFTDLKKDAIVKTDFDSLNIGVFNDTFRDSLAGDGHRHGFIQGNEKESASLASAIIAGVNTYDTSSLAFNKDVFFNSYNLFAEEPSDCLNFLSVHDGLTLWDKINLTVKDQSKKERLRLMKLAYAILFTSQGKIILHSGDEILRTKPLVDFDKEKHRAFTSDNIDTEENVKHFHENSYCSNDFTNMFRWDRLSNEYSEFATELLSYVKGLILMRRNISAFRLNTTEKINNNIRFLNTDNRSENLIHSFKSHQLKKLKLRFINGNVGETYYIVGEIHKNNPNPINNSYKIDFDDYGNAEIVFTKEEIENFDIQKWGAGRNLNFKLVKTPGKWDFPDSLYSKLGHNSISPESLDKNFVSEIDLSVKDCMNVKTNHFSEKGHIAYIIKQEKNHKIIVIHNANSDVLQLTVNELSEPENWTTILDSKHSGIDTVNNSDVKISFKKIIIPGKSSVVIRSK